MNSFENIIQKITNWVAAVAVFLLPFVFVPLTTDFYDFNKLFFLLGTIIVLGLLWIVRTMTTRTIELRFTLSDVGVVLLVLSLILSFILSSTNRYAALVSPFGFISVMILFRFSFFIRNEVDQAGKHLIKQALYISGALLGVLTLYQYMGLGKQFAAVEYLKNSAWSPAGSLLATVLYLGLITLLLVMHLLKTAHKKTHTESLFFWLLGFLMIMGIGVGTYQLFTTAQPVLLPMKAGWFVMLEAFKTHPFFGVGVENFLNAFTTGRPLFLNTTPLWSTRFILSSNVFFHVLTTTGIFGLVSLVLFMVQKVISKYESANGDREVSLMLIAIGVVFFLFPPFFLIMALLFIIPELFPLEKKPVIITLPHHKAIYLIPVIILTLFSFVIYGTVRIYRSDMALRRALGALSQNQGGEAYNLLIKSIQLNPYHDQAHHVYARTNLALANSMAAKKDITDTDRQTITQLIQQAIREAKNSVSLNRKNVIAWENRGGLYRDLLRLTRGADQWALASFNQAVKLDPTNPVLRIAYGGVFFATGNVDEALRQYELATQLKPDLANAWYNLAQTLKEKKELEKALIALKEVVRLVPQDSQDYQKAHEELTALEKVVGETKKTDAKTTKQPETLTAPVKAPEPALTPPVDLPPDSAPPTEASASSSQ